MREILTDEERGRFSALEGDLFHDESRKLLRLYDNAQYLLSEATALLERYGRILSHDQDLSVNVDARAFLKSSRAPAQPAAPVPVGTPEQQFEEWVNTHPDNPNRRQPTAPEPSADRGLSSGGTVDHIGDESERLGFSGANGDRSDEHDQVRDYESGDGAAGGWQVQDPSGSRGDDAENAASRSGWRSSVGTGSAGGAGGLEQEAASKLVLEYGVRWKRRAETAEAKLAAVQEALWYPGATSDQRMLRARAVFILTPAGPNGGAK